MGYETLILENQDFCWYTSRPEVYHAEIQGFQNLGSNLAKHKRLKLKIFAFKNDIISPPLLLATVVAPVVAPSDAILT